MLFSDRSKVSNLNEGVFKCTLFFANIYYYKKKKKNKKEKNKTYYKFNEQQNSIKNVKCSLFLNNDEITRVKEKKM